MSRDDRTEERLDRLESLVEAQQETIEDQQATIEDLQHAEDSERDGDRAGTTMVHRRTALKAGGLLAALGVGAGTASADAQGQVGTSSDPLGTLYTAELNGPITDDGEGSQAVTNVLGEGLTVDGESLAVATGNGVGFDDESLTVTTGNGIGFDGENLTVATGDGIGFDGENLAVTTGNGVGFDGIGQLSIPTGAIDNDMLANDTVEILPGNGVDTSGSVSLGGIVPVAVNPADFAGRNLTGSVTDLNYVPPENVIVVAESDGDHTTVSGALDGIYDNAADNPYVIRVAPGVYNEEIQLKSHVDIVGSGVNATRIETNHESDENLTLQADAATNVEVRRMTVEGKYGALIVQNGGADVTVRQSRLRAVGDFANVVYHDAGALQLRNCLVECHQESSTGILLFGGTVDVAYCQVVALQDAIDGPADVRHSQLVGGATGLNKTFGVCNGNFDAI